MTVPAGQRMWKCPDCGREVMLSVTQLDPLACDACLEKLKGKSKPAISVAAIAQSDLTRLLVVGAAMLLIGLVVGFVVGRISVPRPPFVRPVRPTEEATTTRPAEQETERVSDAPDESTWPGPGYKWVRGYTRKDGVKVKGHWAKAPNHVDSDNKHKK